MELHPDSRDGGLRSQPPGWSQESRVLGLILLGALIRTSIANHLIPVPRMERAVVSNQIRDVGADALRLLVSQGLVSSACRWHLLEPDTHVHGFKERGAALCEIRALGSVDYRNVADILTVLRLHLCCIDECLGLGFLSLSLQGK